MRHRKRGRVLGRSPSHRKALLKNLASALFLTEREEDQFEKLDAMPMPKVKGRVVTTIQKAKEVRPLVEKCITIARKSLKHQQAAEEFATDAERGSDGWKQWRNSESWQKWNQAMAPTVAARRRALQLLGDKHAVSVLFSDIAPRFEDRDGGYTRVLRLAEPRLGDAGTRAILEFVGGDHDRVIEKSAKPTFDDEIENEEAAAEPEDSTEAVETEETTAESDADESASAAEEASDGDADSKED